MKFTMKEIEYRPELVLPLEGDLYHKLHHTFKVNMKKREVYVPLYPPFIFKAIPHLTKIFNLKQIPLDIQNYLDAAKHSLVLMKCLQLVNGLENSEDFFVYTPMKEQLIAMSVALHSPSCGIIYDRGLGKTKIAVDTTRLHNVRDGRTNKVLVVTPLSTFGHWQNQTSLHSREELYADVFKQNKEIPKGDIILINYEKLATKKATAKIIEFQDSSNPNKFDIVWFDESHHLKTYNSNTTKAALQIAPLISKRILLTGSFLKNPLHLYGQLKVIDTRFIEEGGITGYKNKFIEMSGRSYHIVSGFKNLDVLKARVNSCCISKKKEDVLQLPPRQIIDYPISIPKDIEKVYKSFMNNGSAIINGKEVSIKFPSGATLSMALSQVANGWFNESHKDPFICDNCPHLVNCVENNIQPYTSKCQVEKTAPDSEFHLITDAVARSVVGLVDDIIEEDDTNKIIVWFRSNMYMDLIISLMRNKFIIMKGGMDYSSIIKEFNEDSTIKVLLAQAQCGIGWEAHCANYTIYADCPSTAEHYEQSSDRNYRIGTTRKVTQYRVFTENTITKSAFSLIDSGITIGNAVSDPDICNKCNSAGKCVLGGDRDLSTKCLIGSKIPKRRLKM